MAGLFEGVGGQMGGLFEGVGGRVSGLFDGVTGWTGGEGEGMRVLVVRWAVQFAAWLAGFW
jgi:hypothetical protein